MLMMIRRSRIASLPDVFSARQPPACRPGGAGSIQIHLEHESASRLVLCATIVAAESGRRDDRRQSYSSLMPTEATPEAKAVKPSGPASGLVPINRTSKVDMPSGLLGSMPSKGGP